MAREYKPIDVEKAKELFYLSRTSPSGLRHRTDKGKRMKEDDIAGTKKKDGYWLVGMDGKKYLTSRIVWAIKHNRDPGEFIVDHLDFNPSNNNPENLRLLDNSESQKHRQPYGKSRFKGVYWCKKQKKWFAQIKVNGKQIYLGYFDIEEEAGEVARIAFELRDAGLPVIREEILKMVKSQNN